MILKITFFCYTILVFAMALATIAENGNGSAYAHSCYYGSWWFAALWAAMAMCGVCVYVRMRPRLRAFPSILTHLALVIILIGAGITRLTAERGTLELAKGDVMSMYVNNEDGAYRDMPLSMSLDTFRIERYPGSMRPRDYVSEVEIVDDETGEASKATISMNNVYEHGGLRFYQMKYNPQRGVSTLAVNDDMAGTAVTYTGYGMLFLGLLLCMVQRACDRKRMAVMLTVLLSTAMLAIWFNTSYLDANEVEPVLRTGYFGIHVSLMIAGYSLAICAFVASLVALVRKRGVTAMHRWLLVGSVAMSAAGIFVGAIWANVSWGCYWSWDPKETWALITLMVYAVPLHVRLLPAFSQPRVYHLYIVISLVSVAITYWGVNMLLGGMHSYA